MKNILIVDDEKSFLLSLKDGFKVHKNTFSILTAENGMQAVKLLQETSIDLLVTDLKMPVMDGFELLAWASQHQPELPIIVMTAFGKPGIELSLNHHNTLQYLEKPLDLETIESAVLAALEKEVKSYIKGIALSSFLQLMHLEKKSCSLKVTSPEATGYLFLRNGNLVDAEYGKSKGTAAAYEIICWEDTEIEMDSVCRRLEVGIDSPLEMILLEAHRLKDEAGQNPGDTYATDTDEVISEKQQPSNVASGEQPFSIETLNQMLKEVWSHSAVEELGLYDENYTLKKKSPGPFSDEMKGFDPSIYLRQVTTLDSALGFARCNWLSFLTASRNHYLFFILPDNSLAIKLSRGSRVQEVGLELATMIKKLCA